MGGAFLQPARLLSPPPSQGVKQPRVPAHHQRSLTQQNHACSGAGRQHPPAAPGPRSPHSPPSCRSPPGARCHTERGGPRARPAPLSSAGSRSELLCSNHAVKVTCRRKGGGCWLPGVAERAHEVLGSPRSAPRRAAPGSAPRFLPRPHPPEPASSNGPTKRPGGLGTGGRGKADPKNGAGAHQSTVWVPAAGTRWARGRVHPQGCVSRCWRRRCCRHQPLRSWRTRKPKKHPRALNNPPPGTQLHAAPVPTGPPRLSEGKEENFFYM